MIASKHYNFGTGGKKKLLSSLRFAFFLSMSLVPPLTHCLWSEKVPKLWEMSACCCSWHRWLPASPTSRP